MTAAAIGVARTIEHRAPRSAGIAGIIFSLLFVGAVLLAGQRPPPGLTEAGLVEWFQTVARTPFLVAAFYLVPFAGIAFLWFIGVIRDRIGANEDRFLATVFLGSGLLFVAMLWGAIVTSTIALRTNTFPRWLIVASYVIALVMILSLSLLQWILLLFPAWVFVMSLFILNTEIRAFRATGSVTGDAPSGEVK